MNFTRPIGKLLFSAVIALIGLGFVSALIWIWVASHSDPPRPLVRECKPSTYQHPIHIRQPRSEILVDSGKVDAKGEPIMVSCATCHDTRDPVIQTHESMQLDEFHQRLSYNHGDLSCLSCHNADDYNTLKLSDGRPLGFSASMKLCAQCHGPQHRDYKNGSHGGMTGYWDLSRGPRARNSCIDCHDPHHPAYPLVLPVFPPKPVKGEIPSHHE